MRPIVCPVSRAARSRAVSQEASSSSFSIVFVWLPSTQVISPRSSEMTIARASQRSVMPTAALWRVPNSGGRARLSERGRTHPTREILFSRTTAAPSW